MALHDEITNQVLEKCINAIPSKHFTTLRVIDELIKSFPKVVEIVQSRSERNWRSVSGKAVKRFSVETNLIKQISPASETPARWEKMS